MRNATHTGNPLYALKLYNAIEDVIDVHGANVQPIQLEYLKEINNELFYETIIPNGADALKGAVYLNTCNHYENTVVGDLLDLLHVSNVTLTQFVFNEIAKSIHYVLTEEEQLLRLSTFSNYLEQNIEGLIALHNVKKQFFNTVDIDFFYQLHKLQQHPDYKSAISLSQKQRINQIFPWLSQALYGGFICLYQEMEHGERLYLRECESNFFACVYTYTAAQPSNVFKVNFNKTAGGYNFYSKHYNYRSLVIRSEKNKQIDGSNLNVWSATQETIQHEDVDLNWKIEQDGEQVILQNMNSTMYLCAGSERRNQNVYTRDAENFALYRDECKWTGENCQHFV